MPDLTARIEGLVARLTAGSPVSSAATAPAGADPSVRPQAEADDFASRVLVRLGVTQQAKGIGPEARRRLAYHVVVRRGFELVAKGLAASPAECRRFLADEACLATELGSAVAAEIRHHAARAFSTETGICAWCGEAGECHERAAEKLA